MIQHTVRIWKVPYCFPHAADTSFAHFSDLTAALEHVVLEGLSKFFIQVACILSFFKIQQQKH